MAVRQNPVPEAALKEGEAAVRFRTGATRARVHEHALAARRSKRARYSNGPAPTLPRAYTTIMTIMDRLAQKGIVVRQKAGRADADPDLFVPFYTTKPAGSGVGLALAQQIARAHGGEIRLVNRDDGEGARAIVRVPVMQV